MSYNIRKILVPYDGTRSSDKAFQFTLSFAKLHNAKIIALTCIKDKATFGFFKLASDKKIIEKQKRNAIKKINQLQKTAEKSNVPFKSKIVKSDIVSETITRHAKNEKADLIVMSKTKHNSAAEKMYTESVVDRVFDNSPCMFLYVK